MSRGKHHKMATTSVRPRPATDSDSKLERPQAKSRPIEDRVDYAMVRAARSLAERRGEKPMAWAEFKKKLAG
jgi:hypothetical protein